jgi:hypothetical protein
MASKLSKAERLAAIEKQKARLKAVEIQLKAQLNEQKRKEETRQKILIGALVLSYAKTDAKFAHWLTACINKTITKPADLELLKALFPIDAAHNGAIHPSPDHNNQN